MDLTAKANATLDALLVELDASIGNEACRIARMMWLAGFKAGMDTTKALADEAFAELEREL